MRFETVRRRCMIYASNHAELNKLKYISNQDQLQIKNRGVLPHIMTVTHQSRSTVSRSLPRIGRRKPRNDLLRLRVLPTVVYGLLVHTN
jgi:hypothetical protein